MRSRSIAIIAAALMCASFVPRAAHAAVTVLVASGGDREAHSFTTPVVIAQAKGTLTFVNVDLAVVHQVISVETQPGIGTGVWCGLKAEWAQPNGCPILWAPGLQPGGTTETVRGMDRTVSGMTYTLIDPTDPSTPKMSATLVTL